MDTKELWGLEKQLEKFLGEKNKHRWLPARLSKTAQSCGSLQAERLAWEVALCPCSGFIPSLEVCLWPCCRQGAV